jgi:hypothetical protein
VGDKFHSDFRNEFVSQQSYKSQLLIAKIYIRLVKKVMSSLSPNTGEKVNKNVCTWVGGVDQVPIQGLEFNPSAAPQKAVHSTSLLLSHKPVCH